MADTLSRPEVRRQGIWLGVAAYVVWGLSPIFWNLVDDVPPLEALGHRVVWAVPILLLVVAVRDRWTVLRTAYSNPRTVFIAIVGGALLMVNWGVYIWAVRNGHITEVSLGYFISPLVSIALGVIVLREKLRPAQWGAVGVAGAAVVVMTILLGVPPWISLTLAFSFGFYGLLKKRPEAAPALEGLLGEVLAMTIPALIMIFGLSATGDATFASSPANVTFLLATGLMTVVPLLLFGAAAQRIPLTLIGMLQYLAPIMQLLVGIVVFDESLTAPYVVGFTMVWIALVIYTADSVRHARRSNTPAVPSSEQSVT